MKHKRLFYILTIILYVSVVLLSFAFLLSIKSIECNFSSVTSSVKYQRIERELSKYEGKNLLFVNTDKIEKKLEKDPYVIVKKIEKDYPNKLIVEIVEREEAFLISTDTYNYYLDNTFYVLKKVEKSIDEPSVNVVSLNLEQCVNFNENLIVVGKKYNVLKKWVKNSINQMMSIFSDWKNILNEIVVKDFGNNVSAKINFLTKQGVGIEVLDPNFIFNQTTNSYDYVEDVSDSVGIEEINEVYNMYLTISDYEKTKGKLIVYRTQDRKIKVDYSKEEV